MDVYEVYFESVELFDDMEIQPVPPEFTRWQRDACEGLHPQPISFELEVPESALLREEVEQ